MKTVLLCAALFGCAPSPATQPVPERLMFIPPHHRLVLPQHKPAPPEEAETERLRLEIDKTNHALQQLHDLDSEPGP